MPPLPKSFVPDSPINTQPSLPKSFVPDNPAPTEQKPFKYDVAAPVEPRDQKIARLNAEAAASKKESDRANSPLGFAANFGKAFVGNIAPSEVGLGKTLGKLMGNQRNVYSKAIDDTTNTQVNLLKRIKADEALGKDTTKLKQLYNESVDQLQKLRANLNEENNLPTTGQVLGQLGGTALDVLTAGTYGKAAAGMKTGQLATSTSVPRILGTSVSPELGKVSEIAKNAGGLFTKQGVKNVAKGGLVGYGFDVTRNLQEGEEGGNAFKPGLGTLIGAGIPLAMETTKSVQNRLNPTIRNEKIVNNRVEELKKVENNYAKTRRANEFSLDANDATRKRVASTDILVDAVDGEGVIKTKNPGGPIEQYKAMTIDGSEGIVRKSLEKEGAKTNIVNVEKAMMKAINESGLEGADLTMARNRARKEISGLRLRADKDGNIPLVKIHDAKINNTKNINYQTPPEVSAGRKAIARALKETVEQNSSTNVKEINSEIAKYLKDIEYLESLDGRKVKGGKLGKYFAQITGNIVGGVAGGTVGGPVGSALGTVVGGEVASKIKGNSLARTLAGRTGNIAERSKILDEAVQNLKKPRLALPPPRDEFRSSVGSGPTIPLGSKTQTTVDALEKTYQVPPSKKYTEVPNNAPIATADSAKENLLGKLAPSNKSLEGNLSDSAALSVSRQSAKKEAMDLKNLTNKDKASNATNAKSIPPAIDKDSDMKLDKNNKLGKLGSTENKLPSQQTNVNPKNTQEGKIGLGQIIGGAAVTTAGTIPFLSKKVELYKAPQEPTPTKEVENPNVIAGVDITKYATDPNHEKNVARIHQAIDASTPESFDEYIKARAKNSPVTGKMIVSAANEFGLDPRLLAAIFQQDSLFGTKGLGAKTRNPGNVGNTDDGKIVTYKTWEEGVRAAAKFLSTLKIQK